MKKREEYLKQQRDRIQKMKNEERSKQLQSYTSDATPQAVKAAHDVMAGKWWLYFYAAV